jgi:exodeoxyribonuclease V alpha subunit
MELTGRFIRFIYQGANGYTVAVFELSDGSAEDVTIVGYLPPVSKDAVYSLTGDYSEHPRYGWQFSLTGCRRLEESDGEKLVRYLSGPQFKGIGPVFARRMVDALGTGLIAAIRQDHTLLDAVPGMTRAKKQAVLDGLALNGEDRIYFLTANQLSMKNALRLESHYGDKVIAVLTEDPYRMMYDLDGIGFETADRFALALGLAEDDPRRLCALGCAKLMDWCMSTGDSYLPREEFAARLSQTLGGSSDVSPVIKDMIAQKQAVGEEGRLYPVSQYTAEEYISSYLALFPFDGFEPVREDVIKAGIAEVEQEFGISYQDRQKEAIEAFFTNDLMILTGGPGTGKTTIVRGMVKLCQRLYPQYNVTLAAPTGRAAKRLSELTDCDARTIHSLLGWDKETGKFTKNEEDPLTIDLMIIDEFSMVDQWVFYNLLRAGHQFKKIILIGDVDQLPSVGLGSVLRDLIDSGRFKVVRLEKIYRQKEGSGIITLAYDIKHDIVPQPDPAGDVRFLTCPPRQVRQLVLDTTAEALKRFPTREMGLAGVQVLAPMYRGAAGIDALNLALQAQFNPPQAGKKQIKAGYRIYREGDKILQLKNQPEDDVYNGDIGILKEVIPAEEDRDHQPRLIVDYEGRIVEYNPDSFVNITHAYCVSVHKAQGSEYPVVILPVVADYGIMLRKRLLYTAVTRANITLILIGDPRAFAQGLARQKERERRTTLKERLWAKCGGPQNDGAA